MLKILFISLLLIACSTTKYIGRADGSTEIQSYEFLSNTVLDDAEVSINPSGERLIKFKSLDKNRTKGLEKINEGLKLIIEGAAEGVK